RRKAAEREEVDAREDEHAGGRERQEGNRADEERSRSRVPSIGRDRDRPDVAKRERKRTDDDSVPDARTTVEERGSDRERSRRNPEAESGPEPMPVELDRVADQLADSPLGGGGLVRRLGHPRTVSTTARAPRPAAPEARRDSRRPPARGRVARPGRASRSPTDGSPPSASR